jgi:hypothetical protein
LTLVPVSKKVISFPQKGSKLLEKGNKLLDGITIKTTRNIAKLLQMKITDLAKSYESDI